MLLYWLWLAELKKLSAGFKQRLLERFHDPEDLYRAAPEAYESLEGITPEQLTALEDRDLSHARRILDVCRQKGIRILTCADEAYPARLRNVYGAPVVLYCRGQLPDWTERPVIGIVGTRKATPYGMNTALRFGMQIAACGALVVSGGAAGIDTVAVQGALDMGMPAVCVLGCGVDVAYPKSNKALFDRVAKQGCLLSEYAPGTEPYSWNFPQRNRIIRGLSNGLLVVEAPAQSGALSTARYALEQGRDVFAVPGNVDMPTCAGSNDLLRQGALTALSGWDVVREYEALYPKTVAQKQVSVTEPSLRIKVAQEPLTPGNPRNTGSKTDKKGIDKEDNSTYSVVDKKELALSDTERAVLRCIGREETLVDDVIANSGMSAAVVRTVLTKLALKQLVQNRPGGRIILK